MAINIVDLINSQIIPSVRSPELVQTAINSHGNVIFLLSGNILTIGEDVSLIKSAGKYVFIHLDFIEGIANDRYGIQYIAEKIRPTGIITTKGHMVRVAKEFDLYTIQRIFLLDGTGIDKGLEMVEMYQPDAVEVLPGLMPRIIYEITEKIKFPVIAGGLIKTEEEVLEALRAGALAASIGNQDLWKLNL